MCLQNGEESLNKKRIINFCIGSMRVLAVVRNPRYHNGNLSIMIRNGLNVHCTGGVGNSRSI